MKKDNKKKVVNSKEKKSYSQDILQALKEVKREGQAPLTIVDATKDFPIK